MSTNSAIEFVDITEQAQKAVNAAEIVEGLLFLFCPHTTAGLTINEGCDPAVQQDMLGLFRKMLPQSYPCRHTEGNSPAHALATLTGSSVTVIVVGGNLRLGTWQHIFFCEWMKRQLLATGFDQICFGLNRATDERSLALFLRLLSREELLRALIPRLNDAEIMLFVETVTKILHNHLEESEYHELFLGDYEHHH